MFAENEPIVELLLKSGAYVNYKGTELATSLHRAVKYGSNIF